MKINEFQRSGFPVEDVTELEQRNRILARKAAEEGIVLLKNEGILPVNTKKNIALFGSGAITTVKGGTGSGDVNVRRSVSVLEGMKIAGFRITSEDWLSDYLERYQCARETWKKKLIEEAGGVDSPTFFDVYAKNPFQMPDGADISDDDIRDAETAVYVISRTAGEASDRKLEKGDYELNAHEIQDLVILSQLVKNIIVVLNMGGVMDLQTLLSFEKIKGILLMSQAGEEGGNALAHVLTGQINPSGKLTDTWAKTYQDYPAAEHFGAQDGDLEKTVYEEGIYVGYRYFDRAGIEPQFSFGYGLSYTKFQLIPGIPSAGPDGMTLSVIVRNTGDLYSGKEVLQLYAACPQTGIEKEYKRLIAFKKTRLLAPGEEEKLTVTVPVRNFASFDETAAQWKIEKGDYAIFAGTSSLDEHLMLAGVLRVEQDVVLETVEHICPLREELPKFVLPEEVLRRKTAAWQEHWELMKRASRSGKLGQIQLVYTENQAPGFEPILTETIFTPGAEPAFCYQMDELDHMANAIAEGLREEDLIPLLAGRILDCTEAIGASALKVPGAAGETSEALKEMLHIPGITMADGPAGLRLLKSYEVHRETGELRSIGNLGGFENGFFAAENEHPEEYQTYYQYTTAFPVGVCLAQTFNTDLVKQIGRGVAMEMETYHISWWLAPGMNIHRNPLCGRNFEYFSEDPLVSGKMAAAMTEGVQSMPGVGTTIKHFACNNQEDNRMGTDAVVSERALREIYLRGFEIAVKESQPMCMMTSYNKINGVHSANNKDLCTEVARREWNFKGLIMTDWTTTLEYGGSIPYLCTAAGNDLIMPGFQSDLDNIRQAFQEGRLHGQEIRKAAEHVINMVLRSNGYEDSKSYYKRFLG